MVIRSARTPLTSPRTRLRHRGQVGDAVCGIQEISLSQAFGERMLRRWVWSDSASFRVLIVRSARWARCLLLSKLKDRKVPTCATSWKDSTIFHSQKQRLSMDQTRLRRIDAEADQWCQTWAQKDQYSQHPAVRVRMTRQDGKALNVNLVVVGSPILMEQRYISCNEILPCTVICIL